MANILKATKKFEELRSKAEKILLNQPIFIREEAGDILELLHELSVHQVEIEIQNEELKRTQAEITGLQAEFRHLYDFAPCSYITLNKKGIITKINEKGAALFGPTSRHLKNMSLLSFLDPDSRNAYLEAVSYTHLTLPTN